MKNIEHARMATQKMDINDESFERLLQRLEPDLRDSKARYDHLRFKMMKFFWWKRCEDPEGLADETISRIVKHLIAGTEIREPYPFIYGIAINVYREYVKEQIKKESLIQQAPDESAPTESLQDCRTHCLQKLSPDSLELLERYYLKTEDRESLARQLNLTLNALRLQIHRLKKELRTCYAECRRKLHGR